MNKTECTWNPAEDTDAPARIAQMKDVARRFPIAWTDALGGAWTVMRYKDLTEIAADTATFSNGGAPRYGRGLPPLEADPPEHGFFRRLLQPFVMPANIRALEPGVQAAAVKLISGLLESNKGDLARQLAYPMPVMGLCALLGVSHENWEDIKTWSEESLLSDSPDPKDREIAQSAHLRLLASAREMIADRRRNPRLPAQDITAALLAAEIDGSPIDDERIAGILRLLISAGHNSTTAALGNILLYLAENQDAQYRLRREPDKIPAAIEELLRVWTPVQEMPRTATRDIELQGCPIKKGDKIAMFWASANRDEAVFEQPDDIVLDRKPNRHVAFGQGIHACLGAPLARMEVRVALQEFLSRARFFVDGAVERMPFHRMGVVRLPTRFEALC